MNYMISGLDRIRGRKSDVGDPQITCLRAVTHRQAQITPVPSSGATGQAQTGTDIFFVRPRLNTLRCPSELNGARRGRLGKQRRKGAKVK